MEMSSPDRASDKHMSHLGDLVDDWYQVTSASLTVLIAEQSSLEIPVFRQIVEEIIKASTPINHFFTDVLKEECAYLYRHYHYVLNWIQELPTQTGESQDVKDLQRKLADRITFVLSAQNQYRIKVEKKLMIYRGQIVHPLL